MYTPNQPIVIQDNPANSQNVQPLPSFGQASIQVLNTVVLSRLATTGAKGTNCEKDNNEAIIRNFKTLLTSSVTTEKEATEKEDENEGTGFTIEFQLQELDGEEEVTCDTQACVLTLRDLLKNIGTKCNDCKEILYTKEKGLEHIFIEMKNFVKEPSDPVLLLLDNYSSHLDIEVVEMAIQNNVVSSYLTHHIVRISSNPWM
ncbi:unnamed protein product [Colias eurytheme]|nr:unnamed protein product [Colias eurytheme]